MLFITNRVLLESSHSESGRKISFDLNDNQALQSVFFCERHGENDYEELGSLSFFETLKTTSAKQILIYIHGFNNMPEGEGEIFSNAEKLQRLFDNAQENLVEVVPMIWPCDNDFGILKDYWDDQYAAHASAPAFSRVFEKFLSWRNTDFDTPDTCMKRINILSHSMGNRVLKKTLLEFKDLSFLGENIPLIFRNVFMAAPDVVNETLQKYHEGKIITQVSRNVLVFYAADDLALRASKVVNLKNKVVSRRLGHTGPENMNLEPKNVYAFDCDQFNNKCDPKGHTYFMEDRDGTPTPVFEQMLLAISTGRVTTADNERNTVIL